MKTPERDAMAGVPLWVPRVRGDARDPHRLVEVRTCPLENDELGFRRTRIDYVWDGETIPGSPIGNTLYKLYRSVRYGRTSDVESIVANFCSGAVYSYSMATIGHDNTTAWENWCHEQRAVVREAMETDRCGRPLLFVRTWNHSLSERRSRLAKYIK
jgi:hypothetical protein